MIFAGSLPNTAMMDHVFRYLELRNVFPSLIADYN